jgi:hypothetical protein
MDKSALIAYNQRGLIPGPSENEAAFMARLKILESAPEEENPLPQEDWKEAHTITKQRFGFSADWVHACYSNKGLRFWEGAAVWIGDFPRIQLKTAFRKGHYLKIYKREELLAHEAVHAARMAFQEKRFEELLAYQTSLKPWRRFFGPFFRTPLETLLFLLILLISTFSGFLPPLLALLLLGMGRLIRTQFTFFRAQRKLKQLLKNPADALPLLLRLTDREIALFSRAPIEKTCDYILSQNSLRWQMLLAHYGLLVSTTDGVDGRKGS